MLSIKKIENSERYEAIHTQDWPYSRSTRTVLWFALGWKPCDENTVYVST